MQTTTEHLYSVLEASMQQPAAVPHPHNYKGITTTTTGSNSSHVDTSITASSRRPPVSGMNLIS